MASSVESDLESSREEVFFVFFAIAYTRSVLLIVMVSGARTELDGGVRESAQVCGQGEFLFAGALPCELRLRLGRA